MEKLSIITEAALKASWDLLLESSPYILFGIIIGGLLKVFLSTEYVAKHLGKGRFTSVVKAALFGIPIPLCSCGVLPAAAALKKQGANNGATTAFLIATPESGVDSISITYALLDPIMTIARPLSAFLTAFAAGFAENLLNNPAKSPSLVSLGTCQDSSCGCGSDCNEEPHADYDLFGKISYGLKYAAVDIWEELAVWFFVGIILAGIITTMVPDNLISMYLGGGLSAMLLMLVVGVPLYICATASTPIAAALILKGVSPGVALVFLLVGPATNITSISVLIGLLGKRATALYLAAIMLVSVICGLLVDSVYTGLGISAQAVTGQAAEVVPYWLKLSSVALLLLISIKPLYNSILGVAQKFGLVKKKSGSCGCSSGCGDKQ